MTAMPTAPRSVVFTVVVLFAFAWPSHGLSRYAPNTPGQAEPTLAEVIQLAFRKDCPLGALGAAEALEKSGPLPGGLKDQILALVGPDPSLAWADTGARPEVCEDALNPFARTDALPELVRLATASKARVVLLNESHQTQLHRAFAFLFVNALRTEGFSAIAGETFTKDVGSSLADGVPDVGSGTYTVDPVFAKLLRVSHEQGITLFGYDFSEDTADLPESLSVADAENARSAAQARRVAAYIETHPTARIIVLSGSGHGAKVQDQRGIRRLAQRLQEDFSIAVFSVDQVFGTPVDRAYRINGVCISAEAMRLDGPSVVRRNGQVVARSGFDVTVFHPETMLEGGRPQWSTLSNARRLIPLEVDPLPSRTLLRAYHKDDPSGAIAADQVLVPAGAGRAVLVLPYGDFRLVREDESCTRTDVPFPVATRPNVNLQVE